MERPAGSLRGCSPNGVLFSVVCRAYSPGRILSCRPRRYPCESYMTLSVAVIGLAPACGAPFGTMTKSALPSRSSQSEGW
jgi:hypothetical protein